MMDPQKITDHIKKVYGCVIINPYDDKTFNEWVTCKDGCFILVRVDSGSLTVSIKKRNRSLGNSVDIWSDNFSQLDELVNRGLLIIAKDMNERPQPRDVIELNEWTSFFYMTEHVFRHFELLTENLDPANEPVYIYDEMLIS